MSKRARLATQRARQLAAARKLRERRRQRMTVAWGAVGAVALVLFTFVAVKLAEGGPSEAAPDLSATQSAQVVAAVTGVNAALLDQIGRGEVQTVPQRLTGQPALERDGKPLVVYIGAEYCPFCAVQRWGLVVALSRFGTFSGMKISHSASDDVYPNTPTFSFHGATYTSQFLAFDGVETHTNVRKGNSYAPLDTLTDAQLNILRVYDAPPYVSASAAGAIPFIDFANKFFVSGASIDPDVLAGRSAADIAAALSDPASPIAKAVLGSANAFTAVLCELTGGKPAAVCTSAAAKAYPGRSA